ncbi:MAG: sugar phosphate isomerase/epimerase [Candidatus Omnitrophica bacterium]|nr:sugar phosphate isomerase/epimerase [Candidatus Omnitrophota bacterium]
MLSLSTSWNSSKHTNGFDLIKEIKDIGFDTVELNFSLTKAMADDILSLKGRSEIKISSLHNICPLPDEIEPDEASPDYYSLASPDEEERRLAVEVTKNTILYAKKFDAKAVILHTGRVQIKDKTKDLASSIDDENRYKALKEEMMRERKKAEDGYLDNAIVSLEELTQYAKEMNVALAIENRYYYREIPTSEELERIFKIFKKGSLFYWHDAVHAEVFERLGLVRHKDLLDKFSNRLLGVHLHDIIGPINDHRPPGFGTFDFNLIKPYIKEDTIKVIEAHQPATADEICRSVEYLTKILDAR